MRPFSILVLCLFSCGPVVPLENPFESEPRLHDEGATLPPDPAAPLRIIAIDVGQGDGTLVIGPDGTTLLIDTGPLFSGSRPILERLAAEDVTDLDLILLTHFDTDHIGGTLELLGKFTPVVPVIDRGDSTVQDHPLFFSYLDIAGDHRRAAVPGELFSLGHGATAMVVVVNGQYLDGTGIHLNPDEENEASIGLLIEYGEFRYLTSGDLSGGGSPGGYPTKNLEKKLGEIVGDIDILRLSHHGSDSSTRDDFLEWVTPEIAIISVGRENTYHHPAVKVIERLDKRGIEIFRTDQDGTIEIRSDGKGYEMKIE
ncbi:MAG: MBL fold metallo-hydrolase [Deltaproteobacteria bacterium]|nr:MBL fold metallo-hydrolase [Deltaproteobacteria bacterium]